MDNSQRLTMESWKRHPFLKGACVIAVALFFYLAYQIAMNSSISIQYSH